MTLDPSFVPPPPPPEIAPSGVEIGTIAGNDLTRDDLQVTATFDIPAGETVGTKDVAVHFPHPFAGTITYTLDAGFSVLGSGLPVVSIVAADATAAEAGLQTGTFTVARTGDTDGDMTVQLALGGSATAGEDYQAITLPAVIPDGQSSVDMTVTPIDDDLDESTETVTLTISADAAYAIGTAGAATVSILDDDGTVVGGGYSIVDTGQTAFYDNTNEIAAPTQGQAFFGQDAHYDGNQPSYTASADGLTVYDNVTDLTWTQSPDLDGDGNIDVGDKLTYAQAQAYPDTLNAQAYGGFTDWRLPSIKELYSLIDFSGVDPSGYEGTDTSGLIPFIDTDYFDFDYGDTDAGERIIDAQMASSTLYVGNTAGDGGGTLFGVNFADGRIKGYGLTLFGSDKTFYAYFVRGNTDYGVNQLVDNGDGTITDAATELMWSQDDSGTGMNWEDALAWVEQKNAENYLGHDDWRLPNVKELQGIVDYTRSPSTTSSPAIDPVFNTTAVTIEDGSTDYPFFWSGTTHANWTTDAGKWGAYVSFGEAMGYMNSTWVDVHGAGAQRSDPKYDDGTDYSTGNGPQGDAVRIDNFVRLVRDDDTGDQNVTPTAEAGGPHAAQVGDTITLDGSASHDTDGAIAAYAWDLDSDGQYDDATGATATFDATTPGTFAVGLLVTDDDGATDTDAATVTVSELSSASLWTHAEVADEASAFFDDSYVHELHITFDDADWYNTLYDSHANDADDPYFEADFECDGIAMESVGVRFKGNASFSIPGVKKSIKIDFDEFDEDNDDLTFLGLKKLNLNNSFNDPTMLREKLFLDYASNFVEGVSRAVYTNVYINGEYWGLYTAVEQIDKTFVQTRFGSDEDGNLYKGAASDDAGDDPQADFGSDLTWLGSDPALYDDFYQLKTNETAYDYSGLVEFIDVLNNTPTEDLAASIEPLLDVDDALAGLAINNLFANLDSYNGAAHNYYLYDRDDTGQFTHIFWDANESFGTFSLFTEPGQDMAELDPFWLPVAMGPPGTEAEERPLMENLWAVDEYSEDYLRDLAEMLREGFDVTSATERIDELADLIRSDVAADPNKQYTTAQFETNLNYDIVDGRRTIYGLTSFIEDRSNYLDAELDSYTATSDLTLNELMSVNVATVQDDSGDYDPWVEIYNLGPGLVNLSGLYLTDDAGNLSKWALPSGDLDDGEFLTLWIDGETGEGSDHASFSLNAAGGEVHLSDGAAIIDTIAYGALADDESLARVPNGDGDWESTNQPTPGAENLGSVAVLYINEFMADNDTVVEDPDEAGAYEDWVELYNPGTEPVDLSGMYMTDDLSDPVQWQIPAGVTIDAGGYLVVWADNDTGQGDTHASFKLSTDGESIALYNTDGATLIDSIGFGVQTTDVSYGRYPDGTENWTSMTTPTPGAANDLAQSNVAPTAEAAGPYSGTVGNTITLSGATSTDADGAIAAYAWDLDNDGQYDDATGATATFSATTAGTFTVGLRVSDDDGATDTDAATIIITDDVIEPAVLYINEVMADNDTTVEDPDEAGAFEDWIELYNPGVDPIDLSGMYLTDDTSDPLQWQIPDGMTIDAGGHLVLWADNDTDQGGAHASFKLSSDGETIALYDIDGTTLIDSIEYGAQTTDVSYGRYPDGADLWGSMTTPTPGAANAPINAPPTAEAGGPYSGTEGDTITLSGAASTDTDGTITAYAWDLDDDGEYDDATGATTAFTATTAGAFTVGLLVSDDDGGTATDTATVTVASDAIEPVVLYINEFMADNDTFVEDPDEAGAYEDWIELYNPGTEAIDLGGMYMTDDLSDPVQWQIPEGMAIDAGGYLVVWADNDTDQGDAHASFKLSTDGETIALYNTDGATLIDAIAFGVQTTDVSYGRYPDGAETWGSMTTPTPGAANTGIVVAPTAEVKGRHIFYNNSYWDDPNNDPALDDNTAIATDKEALLPGEVADFDNYTSYTLGINGIMVDVAGLPDGYTPDAGDFSFRVGNDSAPGDWTPAAAPLDVTLSANAGADGSDRITITWTDNAIEQTWLEVTVLATEVGLSADDVFYFGNAVGETGNDTANALVTAADVIAIRDNPRGDANRADVANPHDIDRDRLVDAVDVLLARNHATSPFSALNLIAPPEPVAAPPELQGEDEPLVDERLDDRTERRPQAAPLRERPMAYVDTLDVVLACSHAASPFRTLRLITLE